MKKCMFCNVDLPDNANFCTGCGKAQAKGDINNAEATNPTVLSTEQVFGFEEYTKNDDVFSFDETPSAQGGQTTYTQSQPIAQTLPKNNSGQYQNKSGDGFRGGQSGSGNHNSNQGAGFYYPNPDEEQRLRNQQQEKMASAHKKARFIFINCVIFLVFTAIRAISTIASIGSRPYGEDTELSAIIDVYCVMVFMCALIVVGLLITIVVFANKARKPELTASVQFKTGIVLLVMTIITLVMLLNYGILDLILSIMQVADNSARIYTAGTMFFTLAFHITFFVFAILNIVRSAYYMREMKTASNIKTAPDQNTHPHF